METSEDLSLEAKARAWLDMAQTKWRLQTMQHRSRYNLKTGEYKQLPTRVRRFLNGTPVSMKSRVLSLLKESAPYSCPVFDLETGDAKYTPTNTFIRKDGPEFVSGGQDATYTIIQDLLLVDEANDVYGMRDESSCAQIGEAEYHWDEPDVIECPEGSQGVSYQIANVNRDRETDLYSYIVRKVQSLTVHVQPVVVSCDRRKRVTVESWDNVYGEPGSFRWDPVRGGSAPLQIPETCNQPNGDTVVVSVNRNADCTYRVEVQRTEAVSGIRAYSIQKDQYKIESSDSTWNSFAALPKKGKEFGGGKVTRYQSEQNEDGTWNNDTQVSEERKVELSTKEIRRTPRGIVTSYVDTNVASQVDSSMTGFGSRKYTKTPGGLFVNEYVDYTFEKPEDLGLMCTDTAFLKTHENQRTVSSLPGPQTHVPPASGGLVTTKRYDVDNEGFITESVRTDHEHTVSDAERRYAWGLTGNTVSHTHRSLSSGVAAAILASSLGKPGARVTLRITNGNMVDVEEEAFTPVAGSLLGTSCQKTVYQHVHSSTVSAADTSDKEVGAAGGGHVYERTYSVNPSNGEITKRDTDTTELAVPESRRTVRVTPRAKIIRTTGSNVAGRPGDASQAGHTTEFEVTPGGRFNVTLETSEALEGDLGKECSKDAFLHTDVNSKTVKNPPSSGAHVEEAGNGRFREMAYVLGDDGVWTERKTDHAEINEEPQTVNYEDAFGTRTVTRYTSADSKFNAKEFLTTKLIKSVEQDMTRGKKYDARVTEEKPIEVNSGWLHFQKITDKGLAYYYDFIVFRNDKLDTVKQWILYIQNILYTGGDGSYSNSPSINISPNRFGLWDGSIGLVTSFTPKSWAAGGNTSDDDMDEVEYTVKDVSISPMNSSDDVTDVYLLISITTETHKRAAGVGKKKLDRALSGVLMKGSMFSYHPAGQAYSYDIITKRELAFNVASARYPINVESISGHNTSGSGNS